MRSSIWTPERVDLLKKLWADWLSASEIARQIGCGVSRCAVLAKADRLGLPSRAARPTDTTKPVQEPRPTQHRSLGGEPSPRASYPLFKSQAGASAPPSNVGFGDLKAPHCRFPVTEALPYLFCGQTRASGSSYCPHHHALTHTEPLDSDEDARMLREMRVRQANLSLLRQKTLERRIDRTAKHDLSDVA